MDFLPLHQHRLEKLQLSGGRIILKTEKKKKERKKKRTYMRNTMNAGASNRIYCVYYFTYMKQIIEENCGCLMGGVQTNPVAR